MVAPGFWRDRRVLVTGHTGFKGSWLVAWLEVLGARVAGFALAPPTRPSLFQAAGIAGLCEDHRGDVADLGALTRACEEARPELVIHLAAQPLVRASYRRPLETFRTNVLGTCHVLEAARTAGAEAVLVVTSDKCYRNDGRTAGYAEDAPLGGGDPYSTSKAATEMAALGYRAAFAGDGGGPRVACARAGNVIGGGDWAEDRLVPDAIRAFAAGEPLRLRNPDAVRPWQHVVEPLRGYLLLARRLLEGEDPGPGMNFGPADADAVRVGELADLLRDAWGDGARWEDAGDGGAAPPEARVLRLDASRAREVLGWEPAVPLARAVGATVDWYRAHHAGEAREALLERMRLQIEELGS